MKKKVVVGVIVGAMAVSLVACGGKKDDAAGSSVASSVEASSEVGETGNSGNAAMDMSSEASELEETAGDAVVEAVDPFAGVDFSKYKAAKETDDGVVTYAEVATKTEDGRWTVFTANGPFIINVTDDTAVDGEIAEGKFIEYISDGIAMNSYPGQIPHVKSVKVIEENMATVDARVFDDIKGVLAAGVEDGDTVTYEAWIKSLTGMNSFDIVTADGVKAIKVNEEAMNNKEYSENQLVNVTLNGDAEVVKMEANDAVDLREKVDAVLNKYNMSYEVRALDAGSVSVEETVAVEWTEEDEKARLEAEEAEASEEVEATDEAGEATDVETEATEATEEVKAE